MLALPAGLWIVGWLAAQPAEAGGPGHVALVRSEGDERLAVRLAAELRTQRFEVIDVPAAPPGTAPPRELEDALRATGAEAAMRVDVAPEVLRIWIANAVTGKQIVREVALEDHERLDRAIVALWAVELLRASAFAPRPAAVVAARAPSAPPPPTAALEVAPTVAVSPGGLGPSWHLMVGARWQVVSRGGVEVVFLVPTIPVRLEGAGGAAQISMGLAGAGVYVASGPPGARWSAQAAGGAALLVVRATGEASADYRGSTDHAVSGGPYLRAGGALRTTGWLRLRADVLAGVMLPRPVVELAEGPVASWGRPWVAALLGAEAAF